MSYCATWTRDLKAIRLIMLFREEIVHRRRFESDGVTLSKNSGTRLKVVVVSNKCCTSVRDYKTKYVQRVTASVV